MPPLRRITSSTVGLAMGLSLGVMVWVVVLLLVLMRWVHVGVCLGVLLTCHVVGVSQPSLLVVGGVVSSSIMERVRGLVVISVMGRSRHGSAHVWLAQV